MILVCLGLAYTLHGQDQNDLFFRLNYIEAAKLYKHLVRNPDSSFFHTQISENQATQEIGHYLQISPMGESFNYALKTISPIHIQLLNNGLDHSILVKDTLGHVVSTAQVFLNNRFLPFDARTKTYRIKLNPKKGLLEVKTTSHSDFFELQMNGLKQPGIFISYKRFRYTRLGRIVSWPFRILGSPFVYVASNLKRRHWDPPFQSLFTRHQPLNGYIALSKPLYKPGDTLQMKAYVTTPKGRPLRSKLQLEIVEKWGDPVFRKIINPKKPGVYLFDWRLDDTLDIDEDYGIALTHANHKR